jgi:hypothetical protein
MKQNVHKDVYRFAYDEASIELRKILSSFELLCAQKKKVEQLLAALEPELGPNVQVEDRPRAERKTSLPYCTVITRLTVL